MVTIGGGTLSHYVGTCLLVAGALWLPSPAAADAYSRHLQCVYCGDHSALVSSVLHTMFLLLRDLIADTDVAFCLTLHLVYISILFLERVLMTNLSEITSGLAFLLRTVSNRFQFTRILEMTGLLLTGVFSCALSELDHSD